MKYKKLYALMILNSLLIISMLWFALGWISDNFALATLGTIIFLFWAYITWYYLKEIK